MATAGSRLYCLAEDTCVNITLRCPDNPSSPPCTELTSSCRFNCEIRGYDGIFRPRQNWTIYAPNSFADLTITEANLHVTGTMHCGANYNSSCSIQYGLWNCDDFENQCFVSDENTEYIDCTGDAQCQGETKTCQDVNEGEEERTCNVICSGEESCANTTINCGLRTQCNVLCSGEKACFSQETQTTINCPSASQTNCSVLCGSSTTDNSCHAIHINAVDLRGDLNIRAMGVKSLKNAMIYGPSYGDMNVQCNGQQSCDEATFFANDSDFIRIGCNYPANESIEEAGACQSIKLYCPTNLAGNCIIDGRARDTHTNLEIFAMGSWGDTVITSRYKANAMIDVNGSSTMHCADEGHYDASCLIQENWFCPCPGLPTEEPSFQPTTTEKPTMAPTPIPEWGDERQRNGYVIGGVFVGFCVLCCCVFLIWYCFMRDSDGEQQNDAYAVVGDSDVEMPQRQKENEHDDVKEEEVDTRPQSNMEKRNDVVPDQPTNVVKANDDYTD
eukprot:257474_1